MGAVGRVKTKLAEAAIWGVIAAVLVIVIALMNGIPAGTSFGYGIIGWVFGFIVALAKS